MDFIKKHYEKIILAIVLLGLVVLGVMLPFLISSDREKTDEMTAPIFNTPPKPLSPLDLTRESNVLARLQSSQDFDFSTTNKLFNPVEWKKAPDGTLIKIKTGNEIAESLVVSKITPLYFLVTLDSVETNEFGARYAISVEHQGAANPMQRRKREHYVSVKDKTDAFTLDSIKGDPANPDQLILKLADSGETISISKDKPYQRVDGYMADLKYPLENKNFPGRREGDTIFFGGESYIIVAIHSDEVIISASSNQKRTTLRYAP